MCGKPVKKSNLNYKTNTALKTKMAIAKTQFIFLESSKSYDEPKMELSSEN